ncbi:MAG: GtrA family protein [Bacilli bacterium]|jgi:putative flippase GtrA|nr:GtrA family protein [Bacilli bacterium]
MLDWLTKELACIGFIGSIIVFLLCFPWIKKIYKHYEEIMNYLIVGVLTTIVSLVIYYGLVFTILNPNKALELQIANIISWIGAVLFAYITNRRYVFKSQNKETKKEFCSFFGSRLLTLGLDMGIMFLGVTICHQSDKSMKLLSQILVIIGNYILSKLFVFKKKTEK